jgi:hemerythrin-like domain-containing protein
VQHHDDLELIAAIRTELGDMEGGSPEGAAKFNDAVKKFAELTWKHMSTEENVLIPLAQQHLTADDWQEITDAFIANGDSRFGPVASRHFEQMFDQIVNLAPAPIGLG